MKKKKCKIKYDNLCLLIFSLLALLLLAIILFMVIHLIKDLKGEKGEENKVLAEIVDYGYQLKENNTEYFKKVYYELNDLLQKEKEEGFEEEYAKKVSQLFVADFYDLNSKLDKTDVGGVQFVWKDYQESFKNFTTEQTGIYYYVENNVYGNRKQKLPAVKEVTVESIDKIRYSKEKVMDENAYEVKVSITYEQSLGYPTHATLILLHRDKLLEVIEMK